MAHVLDARGMKCPIPVLKAKKALKPLSTGEELQVFATDPGAPKDFEEFCSATGFELVENREDGDAFLIVIRKT